MGLQKRYWPESLEKSLYSRRHQLELELLVMDLRHWRWAICLNSVGSLLDLERAEQAICSCFSPTFRESQRLFVSFLTCFPASHTPRKAFSRQNPLEKAFLLTLEPAIIGKSNCGCTHTLCCHRTAVFIQSYFRVAGWNLGFVCIWSLPGTFRKNSEFTFLLKIEWVQRVRQGFAARKWCEKGGQPSLARLIFPFFLHICHIFHSNVG